MRLAKAVGVAAWAVLTAACDEDGPGPSTVRVYDGGWEVGDCVADIEPTGTDVGDVIPDFVAMDQFGDEVHLHDFCHRHVLVTTGAFWCRPCLDLAERLEELYQQYKDRNLYVITLMYEDSGGDAPDQEDLQEWVDRFDITTPVLSDPFRTIGNAFIADDTTVVHTENFVLPGMVLHIKDDSSLADAEVLSELLPP